MVLTPQLLQAIKLLQMPSAELSAFIKDEARTQSAAGTRRGSCPRRARSRRPERLAAEASQAIGPASNSRPMPPRSPRTRHRDRQRFRRATADARPTAAAQADGPRPPGGLSGTARRRRRAKAPPKSTPMSPRRITFAEHLRPAGDGRPARPRRPRSIVAALIDCARRVRLFPRRARSKTSPTGSAPRSTRVERVLRRLQGLEPTGVFARDLAECLTLQLHRARPLRSGDAGAGRQSAAAGQARFRRRCARLCGVDDEDLADMIAEIRRLDPKPGRAFGGAPEPLAIPDVIVAAGARPRLADRAQRRGAAARARQRNLRRPHQAQRHARRGPRLRLDAIADRALADEKPRAARAHHSQRRLARSCAARMRFSSRASPACGR